MPDELNTKDQPHGDPDAQVKPKIPGCIDQTAIRYEEAGMPPALALSRAEQDCFPNNPDDETEVGAGDTADNGSTTGKDVGEKRNIPQSARDKMPAAEFAGPHQSFPIAKPEDITAAAKLIGKADNPEAVKARIIAIAKKRGWEASLPQAWQDDEASEKPGAADEKEPPKKSWRQKIDHRLKELGILPDKPTLDTQVSFKVAGNHWLAVWSNNFKDRDGEIFPQKAIDAYVSRVDMGIVSKPELWVWHIPGTRIGQADWVGRHEHFLIAGGTFDENPAAQTAKAYYAKNANKTADSHGFSFPTEQYDGKHYHKFNSFEVTLLPVGVEANSYTSLEGVKEMALTEQKKKYLVDVFGKDHAEQILANLEARGKALEDLGVEYKDFADADLTATDTKALETSFKELIPDLIEGSAEAVTSSLEAVKLVKAMKSRLDAQDAELATVRQALAMRPRASQSPATMVDPEKAANIKTAMDQQSKKFDEFWQVPLKK